jgi:hypothetical protein
MNTESFFSIFDYIKPKKEKEEQETLHEGEVKKMVSLIENEQCLNCENPWNGLGDINRGDGFCSDNCSRNFGRELTAKEAEGIADHNRHIEIGAKKFGISKEYYRQLNQTEEHSDDEIKKILKEEEKGELKKAA